MTGVQTCALPICWFAANQQAWIFEAFAQADVGISRKFGGTGLGLTIAKELAIRLGGDLTVDSTLGAGSTFSVVLPIAGPAAGDPPAPRVAPITLSPPIADQHGRRRESAPPLTTDGARDATGDLPGLDGKTVMIVDDDMRNVYQLSSALRGKRLHVITAVDGQEALDELDRHAGVDLVLIDMMMSPVGGYDAARRIRGVERFRDLPIIALTAPQVPDERELWIAAGASDHVTKPVDVAHLLGVLRGWLA